MSPYERLLKGKKMPPILTEKRRVYTNTAKDVIIETAISEDLCVKTGDPNHPYANVSMYGTWKITAVLASVRTEKVLDGPTSPFHMPLFDEESQELARFLMENKLERGNIRNLIISRASGMLANPNPNGPDVQFRD
jgi:hypothetical protein